jgi:hypothetical protein
VSKRVGAVAFGHLLFGVDDATAGSARDAPLGTAGLATQRARRVNKTHGMSGMMVARNAIPDRSVCV